MALIKAVKNAAEAQEDGAEASGRIERGPVCGWPLVVSFSWSDLTGTPLLEPILETHLDRSPIQATKKKKKKKNNNNSKNHQFDSGFFPLRVDRLESKLSGS